MKIVADLQKPERPSAGFTLLEVLLAVVIFVGSAAVLSRLVLIGMESAEYANIQAQAWNIAESRLEELNAGVLSVSSGGTFSLEEDPQWQYTVQSESTDTNGLYRVTVEVRKLSGKGTGYSLRLLRYYFDESSVQNSTSGGTTS